MTRLKIILFIILISVFINGCKNRGKVYNADKKLTFVWKRSNSEQTDTLSLKVINTIFKNDKIRWSMTRNVDNMKKTISIEDSFLETDSVIIIPPPQSFFLEKSVLLPRPNIKYPLAINKKWDWAKKVDSKNKFNDIFVKGYSEIIDKINYVSKNINLECWEINNEGVSEVGTYNATFYFNEEYGFVYFKYNFEEYSVEINLVEIDE